MKPLTILHVAHGLAEARRMGARVALLHGGSLHGLGGVEEAGDALRGPVRRRPQRAGGDAGGRAVTADLRNALHVLRG